MDSKPIPSPNAEDISIICFNVLLETIMYIFLSLFCIFGGFLQRSNKWDKGILSMIYYSLIPNAQLFEDISIICFIVLLLQTILITPFFPLYIFWGLILQNWNPLLEYINCFEWWSCGMMLSLTFLKLERNEWTRRKNEGVSFGNNSFVFHFTCIFRLF